MTTLDLTRDLAPDDDELVQMLSEGRLQEAMTGIQERYGRRVFHFVHGMVRDTHLAQDVSQEVFEKVLWKHDLYQPGTNFRAWLFEVARNQALSALRAQRRLPRPISALQAFDDQDGGDLLASIADPREDRALEEQEFMAAFALAVDELPEHYQVVFDLCVRQGKPYQEAGRVLNLPTGTVAIRILRARKRLFGALQKHLDRLRRPPACFQ
ncbi:MAG TPA: sigma-70 family RNA polymerase sigma factor [Planctomycetota bacterium]|nr:sigma-70 family RNA polymerase sigma factor [Planctomycetota bacterium]